MKGAAEHSKTGGESASISGRVGDKFLTNLLSKIYRLLWIIILRNDIWITGQRIYDRIATGVTEKFRGYRV